MIEFPSLNDTLFQNEKINQYQIKFFMSNHLKLFNPLDFKVFFAAFSGTILTKKDMGNLVFHPLKSSQNIVEMVDRKDFGKL